MADSIKDILEQGQMLPPPEIAIIQEFVAQRFGMPVGVTLQPQQIIISTPGAALAGSLRLHLHELQRLLKTDKRLVIRIIS